MYFIGRALLSGFVAMALVGKSCATAAGQVDLKNAVAPFRSSRNLLAERIMKEYENSILPEDRSLQNVQTVYYGVLWYLDNVGCNGFWDDPPVLYFECSNDGQATLFGLESSLDPGPTCSPVSGSVFRCIHPPGSIVQSGITFTCNGSSESQLVGTASIQAQKLACEPTFNSAWTDVRLLFHNFVSESWEEDMTCTRGQTVAAAGCRKRSRCYCSGLIGSNCDTVCTTYLIGPEVQQATPIPSSGVTIGGAARAATNTVATPPELLLPVEQPPVSASTTLLTTFAFSLSITMIMTTHFLF